MRPREKLMPLLCAKAGCTFTVTHDLATGARTYRHGNSEAVRVFDAFTLATDRRVDVLVDSGYVANFAVSVIDWLNEAHTYDAQRQQVPEEAHDAP